MAPEGRQAVRLAPRRRGRLPWAALAAILVAVLVAAAAVLWIRIGPEPVVTIRSDLPGIGPRTVVTSAAEAGGRGLGSIRVELIQGGEPVLLEERIHRPPGPFSLGGGPVVEATLEVEVGRGSTPGLVEGEATVRVTVERPGTLLRRPRPRVAELTLPVRFRPPELNSVRVTAAPTQSGSGVLRYLVGDSAVESGVEVGPYRFPGHPLPGGDPQERFALFGVPYDSADPSPFRLVARDELGNEANVRFLGEVEPSPLRSSTIRLSDGFMARVVPAIMSHTPELEDRGSLLDNYLMLNGELRRMNAERMVEIAADSAPRQLWRGPFRQMRNTQVMDQFATRRQYLYEGRVVDTQDHLGFDLASRVQDDVPAANSGVVVLTEYFGIYGNTVIVDHGYGLQTLYSHLSRIDVEVGQEVEAGQRLGLSGQTGLAGGDHLHFAVLLGGLPVNPLEWFDARWIRDHVGTVLPLEGSG
ncbi:MAG: M23 family metallopeptidase [Holophagales bacterium]|nr:M23 family metallopeptidase [Holophagales bacterium]MYC08854.1 M23 family metallopeptidase [Holophagales bacterium]